MANQVSRRDLERWLRDQGFTLETGGKTGHIFYVRDGVKITLPGHGPVDLTKKHVGPLMARIPLAPPDMKDQRPRYTLGWCVGNTIEVAGQLPYDKDGTLIGVGDIASSRTSGRSWPRAAARWTTS